MKKISIEIDYGNICLDYNTTYLDRDNTDPDTKKCMKKVMLWTKDFIATLVDNFEYKMYNLASNAPVKVDDVASKRFLFYSLEKEITLQSYVIQKEKVEYNLLNTWASQSKEGILIKNDDEGGCITVYLNEDSDVHTWIKTKLEGFPFDSIPFSEE